MSLRSADWDRRIGRHLKLRDLHVLSAVVQLGSMAKAASHLSVTQPAISQAIADLERVVGVRLVDRGPRGVVPTAYGETLLKRGIEAFDALTQGMRDIEFLSNPGSGEVRVGADMSYIAGGFMSAIIQHISQRHPKLRVHVVETTTTTAAPEFLELRERKVDLMLGRLSTPVVADDLQVETLFDESIVVVASAQNRWAGRRKIDLGELLDEPWILAPHNNVARRLVEDAFRDRNLEPPLPRVTTYSMQLRLQLLASGRYLTVFTDSTVRYSAERWSLKILPVKLGPRLPVVAVTLKNRTLTPSVQLFIDQVRAVTKTMSLSGEIPCHAPKRGMRE
jgi:DNA-binding transcriptional LysR family regulator